MSRAITIITGKLAQGIGAPSKKPCCGSQSLMVHIKFSRYGRSDGQFARAQKEGKHDKNSRSPCQVLSS